MQQKIIWLSGWAGAGKDTIAAFLGKKHDYTRVAFADSLKDIVAETYGFERCLCDTPEGKNFIISSAALTVRQILIKESAAAKEKNINVYAEHVLAKIQASQQKLFVISDWRFPHEIDCIMNALPEAQHVRIRITRPGLQALADPSEHALDNFEFDTHIKNTTLDRLEKDVVKFLNEL
jgi:hypothetical protein